jgi:hypothetical protein
VAFTNHAFELNALARVLARHSFEIRHERRFAIGHRRIVLRVGRADVLSHGFRRASDRFTLSSHGGPTTTAARCVKLT